jgi:signal transduction histidine kinase
MIEIHQDPLHEVRVAKRWAVAGIAGAVAALLPVYALLLGLRLTELAFVVAPAAAAAFAGIELGSRWEYRMRRRYAYPHRLGYEMGAIHNFQQSAARGAELLGQWLKPSALVVAWSTEDGQHLWPAASFGLPEGWLERAPPVPLAQLSLGQPLEAAEPFRAWFAGRRPAERITVVPLVARDRPEGVLAICGAGGNAQIKDHRLLAAIGTVMGLALDNARLYEDQRAHARHLQELNRMKSDFLSTVSHELRTPLTSIMMAAEMLLEEEESRDPGSTRGRLVRNIVKGASRLSSLVSDLVNVSREDEFQPRLELDAAPVADVIGNAVSIIHPLVTAKHQRIDVLLESTDDVVMVDRLRFDQVLINLLSNAQRYSPPGGEIRLRTKREGDELVISVTDCGPGVADEDRELIFEPFYRGDRSGLGLGLAIAKSIVELHNGRIWVENADGQGSRFCVALPVHGVTHGRKPPARATA